MDNYKVGDKVCVRKDLKVGIDYGCNNTTPYMVELYGQVVTITKCISNGRHLQYHIAEDKRGYFWTNEMFEPIQPEEITITRHGDKVVAKFGNKVGVAKCSPDDTFDFAVGAKLAFSRLMGEPEDKPKPKQEFKVGEFVRVIGNSRPTHYFPIGSIVRIMDVYKSIGKVSCYGLSFCRGEYSFSKQVINNNDLEHLPENTHAD